MIKKLHEFDPTVIGLVLAAGVGGALGAGVVKVLRTIQAALRTGKPTAAERAWDKLSPKDQHELERLFKLHEATTEHALDAVVLEFEGGEQWVAREATTLEAVSLNDYRREDADRVTIDVLVGDDLVVKGDRFVHVPSGATGTISEEELEASFEEIEEPGEEEEKEDDADESVNEAAPKPGDSVMRASDREKFESGLSALVGQVRKVEDSSAVVWWGRRLSPDMVPLRDLIVLTRKQAKEARRETLKPRRFEALGEASIPGMAALKKVIQKIQQAAQDRNMEQALAQTDRVSSQSLRFALSRSSFNAAEKKAIRLVLKHRGEPDTPMSREEWLESVDEAASAHKGEDIDALTKRTLKQGIAVLTLTRRAQRSKWGYTFHNPEGGSSGSSTEVKNAEAFAKHHVARALKDWIGSEKVLVVIGQQGKNDPNKVARAYMVSAETGEPVSESIDEAGDYSIQYRVPGKGWKQKTFPNQAAAEKWVERLVQREGDDVEVNWERKKEESVHETESLSAAFDKGRVPDVHRGKTQKKFEAWLRSEGVADPRTGIATSGYVARWDRINRDVTILSGSGSKPLQFTYHVDDDTYDARAGRQGAKAGLEGDLMFGIADLLANNRGKYMRPDEVAQGLGAKNRGTVMQALARMVNAGQVRFDRGHGYRMESNVDLGEIGTALLRDSESPELQLDLALDEARKQAVRHGNGRYLCWVGASLHVVDEPLADQARVAAYVPPKGEVLFAEDIDEVERFVGAKMVGGQGAVPFSVLKVGDRFRFPKSDEINTKTSEAGGYKTADGRRFKTGKHTAVIRAGTQESIDEADAVPKGTKTHKGIFYFRDQRAARLWAESNGWPIDRIIQYERGWAVQSGKSGNYAGPGEKPRQWKGAQESVDEAGGKAIKVVVDGAKIEAVTKAMRGDTSYATVTRVTGGANTGVAKGDTIARKRGGQWYLADETDESQLSLLDEALEGDTATEVMRVEVRDRDPNPQQCGGYSAYCFYDNGTVFREEWGGGVSKRTMIVPSGSDDDLLAAIQQIKASARDVIGDDASRTFSVNLSESVAIEGVDEDAVQSINDFLTVMKAVDHNRGLHADGIPVVPDSDLALLSEEEQDALAQYVAETVLGEVSPPGWKGTVKAMKRRHPEIDNPWALAWHMKKRGRESHYRADGTRKDEGEDTPAAVDERQEGVYWIETRIDGWPVKVRAAGVPGDFAVLIRNDDDKWESVATYPTRSKAEAYARQVDGEVVLLDKRARKAESVEEAAPSDTQWRKAKLIGTSTAGTKDEYREVDGIVWSPSGRGGYVNRGDVDKFVQQVRAGKWKVKLVEAQIEGEPKANPMWTFRVVADNKAEFNSLLTKLRKDPSIAYVIPQGSVTDVLALHVSIGVHTSKLAKDLVQKAIRKAGADIIDESDLEEMQPSPEVEKEYAKLSKWNLTALQGLWRRIGDGDLPAADRKDKEALIQNILSVKFGEDESVEEGYQHVHWKGAKSLRFKIAMPGGKMKSVQGRTFGKYLGIHMDNKVKGGDWVVTHIPTGYALGHAGPWDEQAVKMAKSLESRLGDKLDFTDPSSVDDETKRAIQMAAQKLSRKGYEPHESVVGEAELKPGVPATVAAGPGEFIISFRTEQSLASPRRFWTGKSWSDDRKDARQYGSRKEASADLRTAKKSLDEALTPRTLKVGRFYEFTSSQNADGPTHVLFVTGFQKNGTAYGIAYDVDRNKAAKASFNGYNLSNAREVEQSDMDGRAKAQIARKLDGKSFEDFTEDVDDLDELATPLLPLRGELTRYLRAVKRPVEVEALRDEMSKNKYVRFDPTRREVVSALKSMGAKKTKDGWVFEESIEPTEEQRAEAAKELHRRLRAVQGQFSISESELDEAFRSVAVPTMRARDLEPSDTLFRNGRFEIQGFRFDDDGRVVLDVEEQGSAEKGQLRLDPDEIVVAVQESQDPFEPFGFRMGGDGKLQPIQYEAKKYECPRCHEGNAYAHEAHADTGMDEMVVRCPDCGKDTPFDEMHEAVGTNLAPKSGFGNAYFRVVSPFSVYAKTGTSPTNAYYGSARVHDDAYEKRAVQKGDEIHVLAGGVFVVPKQGKPFEARATETGSDRWPLDKLEEIGKKAARDVQYRESVDELGEGTTSGTVGGFRSETDDPEDGFARGGPGGGPPLNAPFNIKGKAKKPRPPVNVGSIPGDTSETLLLSPAQLDMLLSALDRIGLPEDAPVRPVDGNYEVDVPKGLVPIVWAELDLEPVG